ncbi:reverse transcriptase domain-containing protein, partial [Tanacetum coccineum]
MAPRGRPTRTTRSRPVTTTPPPVTTTPPPVTDPTTTTSVTSAQLQAMIDEGVNAVLAARAATRNGDDSHTSGTGARRNERTVRECTYQDFMKCQPIFFRGTEEVVNLTQWFERMETVFRISNCTVENQVKFATCTLMGMLLTWIEIKEKFETECGNLKVQGTDVVATTNDSRSFRNCWSDSGFSLEEDLTFAERADRKTRGEVGRGTSLEITKPTSRKQKAEILAGGFAAGGMVTGNVMRGLKLDVPSVTSTSHFKKDCPQWKNKNQGNGNAIARAYAVGVAGQNPDNNVVTGTFLLNNHCASILFDTGADRSFVSTQFSTLINIAPTILDHGYNVELADGRIIWVNTVLLGCTLNFLNHLFHVDLMPVEMGTYDVIIGMDWLTKYQAVIDCAKKIVRIPFGSEILIFHGDG